MPRQPVTDHPERHREDPPFGRTFPRTFVSCDLDGVGVGGELADTVPLALLWPRCPELPLPFDVSPDPRLLVRGAGYVLDGDTPLGSRTLHLREVNAHLLSLLPRGLGSIRLLLLLAACLLGSLLPLLSCLTPSFLPLLGCLTRAACCPCWAA